MPPGPRALPGSFKVSPLPGLALLGPAAPSLDPWLCWAPRDATQTRLVFLQEVLASKLRASTPGLRFQALDQADSRPPPEPLSSQASPNRASQPHDPSSPPSPSSC